MTDTPPTPPVPDSESVSGHALISVLARVTVVVVVSSSVVAATVVVSVLALHSTVLSVAPTCPRSGSIPVVDRPYVPRLIVVVVPIHPPVVGVSVALPAAPADKPPATAPPPAWVRAGGLPVSECLDVPGATTCISVRTAVSATALRLSATVVASAVVASAVVTSSVVSSSVISSTHPALPILALAPLSALVGHISLLVVHQVAGSPAAVPIGARESPAITTSIRTADLAGRCPAEVVLVIPPSPGTHAPHAVIVLDGVPVPVYTPAVDVTPTKHSCRHEGDN